MWWKEIKLTKALLPRTCALLMTMTTNKLSQRLLMGKLFGKLKCAVFVTAQKEVTLLVIRIVIVSCLQNYEFKLGQQ